MGPQGCSSGRPTSSCFSTRAGGSLSQLSVQCLSSFFYHQLLCKTFGDPAVLQPCKNGTARIVQHLRQDFGSRHPELQVYAWACQWNKGLPNARILPKGSKQFSKARPIIAYTKCWHTKASSFLATALYSIMQILLPPGSTLNVNSVMRALQLAWRRLQHMDPVDEEQVMIQQDPIGFFHSVPPSRICSALQLTLDRLQRTLRPTSRRFGLSGGPQNRHQRPAILQGTAEIPRIQLGDADSTCYGANKVFAAVCVLQSRAGYLLSDTIKEHAWDHRLHLFFVHWSQRNRNF